MSSQNRIELIGPKAGTSGAVVCPPTVNAGSEASSGAQKEAFLGEGGASAAMGCSYNFSCLYGGAEQLVIALFRHLWKFLSDFAVLEDGPKIVHRARVDWRSWSSATS